VAQGARPRHHRARELDAAADQQDGDPRAKHPPVSDNWSAAWLQLIFTYACLVFRFDGHTVAMNDSQAGPTVLVVEDEETIAEFVSMGLSYAGFQVAVARDGNEGLAEFRRRKPELVILDVMLPELDGFAVLRKIRLQSDVPVLMLTARGDVDDRVQGLELGADDYLPKPFKFKELLARVRALLRRAHVEVVPSLHAGPLSLRRDTHEVTVDGGPLVLTPREFDLLDFLLSHPRQVFSRETILNRVWGYDFIGDTNVVEVHISALRQKLGPHRELIQTVRGVGYTLRGA
jgi:DNA-binding response OmpR family regulator